MPRFDTRHFNAVLFGLTCAMSLAAFPATGANQSSNSSSNCSNGDCSRIDSLTIRNDRAHVRSWQRIESSRERENDWNRLRRPHRDDDD
jgi:hypothetical protein